MDLANKRLFLLDLDGTIYLEDSLLPGAAEFLEDVRSHGGTVRYLTNNSSRGVDAGLEKMARLGVAARREEFLTAVEATVHYLRTCRPAGEAYFAVGTASFCRLLCRGVDFLATNPDLACPTLFGFLPDCGSICAMLRGAAGREPHYIGKPDPTMIRLALEQTGCARSEALMVGDRLYTDIACGVNAGVDTALVLTGEATAADAAASSTPPTAVYRDMAALLADIREARR